MSQQFPAAWYPDPESPDRLRYFDGCRWTDRVMLKSTPLHTAGGLEAEVSGNTSSSNIPKGYAVVDLETTGLFPGGSDRIAEVAVVQVSMLGEIEDSWSTLINPRRDLGPQTIHGITAAQVLNAPLFEDIAGHLNGLFENRILVAHNADFELRFLRAAFASIDYEFYPDPLLPLCTLSWSRHFLKASNRSLAACCEAAGVSIQGAHSALGDAQATAKLLQHYIKKSRQPSFKALTEWSQLHGENIYSANTLPSKEFKVTTREAHSRELHFVEQLVERLPNKASTEDEQKYLALVDRALIDRVLSIRETHSLIESATAFNIGRERVAALHRDYLRTIAEAAWEDGEVTLLERKDLHKVADLLGLTQDDVDKALSSAKEALVLPTGAPHRSVEAFKLAVGDSVVFTGSMKTSREDWERRAADAGLIPKGAITKKVTLLVAADPDSLSGKARKAFDYGIPIINEDAFSDLLQKSLQR